MTIEEMNKLLKRIQPKTPRFISTWNCKSGMPSSQPPTEFKYEKGDYFYVTDAYEVDRKDLEPYDASKTYADGDFALVEGGVVLIAKTNTGSLGCVLISNVRPRGTEVVDGKVAIEEEKEFVCKGKIYIFDGEGWILSDMFETGDQPNPSQRAWSWEEGNGESIILRMDAYTASIVKDAIVHEVRRMAQTMPPARDCDDITMLENVATEADMICRLHKVFDQLEDGCDTVEEKSQS